MGLLPDAKILEIKAATDLIELVGEYLPLHKRGRTFLGLCPFHDDHKPSLTVSAERQTYRCWACGAGGTVVDFVMAMDGLDFLAAIEQLAHRKGIRLEREPGGRAPQSEGPDRGTIFAALTRATEFFEAQLADSPAAAYLTKRRIASESVRRFRIGYAPPGWRNVRGALGREFSEAVLLAAGLIRRPAEGDGAPYDVFRNRLIFPITDPRGRVLGFGGRVLAADGDEPKYLNTPQTPVYNKSRVLFGLHLARQPIREAKRALVMEGYTDVIMAHQHGVGTAVATCGVALTEDHLKTLRFADRVSVLFDGDEAGARAAERVVALLIRSERPADIVSLPEKLDPCDFLLERGAEAFSTVIAEHAQDPFTYVRARVLARTRLSDPYEHKAALDALLAVVREAKSEGFQAVLVAQTAQALGLDESAVRRALARTPAPRVAQASSTGSAEAAEDLPTAYALFADVLACALGAPPLAARALAAFPPARFPDGPLRALAGTLAKVVAAAPGPGAWQAADVALLAGPAAKTVLARVLQRLESRFGEAETTTAPSDLEPEEERHDYARWLADLIDERDRQEQHRQASEIRATVANVPARTVLETEAPTAVQLQALLEVQRQAARSGRSGDSSRGFPASPETEGRTPRRSPSLIDVDQGGTD